MIVIGGDGSHMGSTTTDADGNYTVKVPGNATYLVKVTSGNIVLKAIYTVGAADATVNVNPGTTVTVAVLEMALGAVLDDGTTFSAALSGVDVNAAVTQIAALPTYTAAANAAVAAVAANTDPTTAASTVTTTSTTITYVAVSAAPTGVSAAAGNGQVTISWTAVAGADSYNVYYGTSAGVSAANGTKAISASANCTITGLTNGTAYYFVVTAVNAGGESAVSSEAIATPQAPVAGVPTGVTATAGDGQVTVSWTAVTGAASYNVYYKTSTGVTIANGTKSAGTTSGSTITGLANGTAYYFVVTAINAGGESAVSGEVGATPQVSVVGAPTGVTATGGNGQVTVSWTAVTGATSYNVYYKTSAGVTTANGTKSAGATAGGAITGLANGTVYYFVVTAVNAGGESVVSSEVSTTPVAVVTASVYTDAFTTDNWTEHWCWSTSGTGQSHSISGGTATVSHSSGWAGSCIKNTNVVVDGTKDWILEVTVTTTSNSYAAGQAFLMRSDQVEPNHVGSLFIQCSPNLAGGTLSGPTTGVTNACGNKPLKLTKAGSVYTWYVNGVQVAQQTQVDANLSTSMYPMLTYAGDVGGSAYFTNLTVTYTAGTSTTLMGGAVQNPLTLTGAVTTFAGSAGVAGSTDATGAAARFNQPVGVTTDGTNLYVADSTNQTIRKVVIATGATTTLAGGAGISGSTDGTGTAARFYAPSDITTDGANLYVADNGNHTIRKVVIATGVVTTIAGSAGTSGSTDGTGTAARFYYPAGITTDGTNLYVVDVWNHTIRKIVIATGVVTTLAGSAGVSGTTDGTGTAARFYLPSRVTTDGTNLYVTDSWNNSIRKVVIATGVVTTLAGSTTGVAGSTDGTGTAARFDHLIGITMDGTNLYVTEYNNHTIRKVVIATGVVTTLAGSAGVSGSADGTGTAARFINPYGIGTDGTSLYVADTNNHNIRKIQ